MLDGGKRGAAGGTHEILGRNLRIGTRASAGSKKKENGGWMDGDGCDVKEGRDWLVGGGGGLAAMPI